MEIFSLKAYAKINLGLDVLRRLDNGYHEVKMIMQTVGIYDELTFTPKDEGIVITTDNGELPTDDGNLIYKAAKMMMDKYNVEKGIHIHLQKNIPIAAGMAGGSTDAAAAFRGVNRMFGLGASEEELKQMAVKVGADVPYCLMGGTALSEGIGEVLSLLPATPQCFVLIAKPDINVSTKFVYENLHANELKEHPDIDGMVEAIKSGSLEGVITRLGNVLETVTVKKYPIIEQIKENIHENGALGVLMSGSGPTVFGLFEDKNKATMALEALKQTNMAKQLFVTQLIELAKEDM